MLSYAYSGAEVVQDALAAGAHLACTSGTGILPLCAAAAEAWRRIEARPGPSLSPLAAATIRGMVTAQVTEIVARVGQGRWCELAAASPQAADAFLRVFPGAHMVCAHRSSLDVVSTGVRASPWGLQGPGLVPHLLSYPGNNVAALAAYWVQSTEQLLSFEHANPQATHRLRYEDAIDGQGVVLPALRAALRLDSAGQANPLSAGTDTRNLQPAPAPEASVPVELIPEPLRERISSLHTELGYPPPS